ncbi:hypothetical protein J132_02151 [Termitomyces sp. J132]|nr:hypothetical protein H2248_005526 [Termitomyces sp. 'cryptogamus']KNZ72716.1 hypothetical protein J132_02151 [Termitomyces sp. J132]
MLFHFVFGRPPLLKYTQSSNNPSGNSQDLASQDPALTSSSDSHFGSTNTLTMIEEVEDSDGTIALVQPLYLPLQTSGGEASFTDATIVQRDTSDMDSIEDSLAMEQLDGLGTSDSGASLTWKCCDSCSSGSHSHIEVDADGIYHHHTKVRVIQDPGLRLQNSQLSTQLNEERARVDILTVQLCQMQHKQVATAWVARGVYDEMSSQLQAAVDARNSEQDSRCQIPEDMDHTRSHGQRLQQTLDKCEESHQWELQEWLQQEHQNITMELEATFQQQLQALESSHEEVHQFEVHHLQEEYQQQIAESARAQGDLETRIQELEEI